MEIFHSESQEYLKEFEDKIQTKSAFLSDVYRKDGNKLYQSKDHTKADHRTILSRYSESIAYAPNNSPELAYGYGNRSALLFHLKKYDDCLHDIELALKLTTSSDLVEKLVARKSDCLRYLAEQEKKTTTAPKKLPKLVPSKELPCASDAVQLRYNRKFGRHLVANRDIKTGEFLIIERGYAFCPRVQQLYIVCSHCLSFTWSSLPCEGCVYAVYCSDRCRKEAQQKYHQLECFALPYLFCNEYFEKSVESMLSIRLFIRALQEKGIAQGIKHILSELDAVEECRDERTKGFGTDGKFHSDSFRACCSLTTHLDKIEEDRDEYTAFAERVWMLFMSSVFKTELKTKGFQEIAHIFDLMINLLIKIRRIVTLNPYEYTSYECSCGNKPNSTDHEESCIIYQGSMLAPCSSLINHSCHFNVEKVCQNGKIILLSLRPIKKDEQLFYCYGPCTRTEKTKKQSHLKEKYFFKCDCEACHENWPVPTAESDSEASQLFDEWASARPNLKKMVDDGQETEHTEENLAQLSEAIDEIYAQGSTSEADIKSLPYKCQLLRWYYALYGTEFDIPECEI